MPEERKRLVISAEDLAPRPADAPQATVEDAEGATEVMQPTLPSVEGVRPQAKPVVLGGSAPMSLGGTLPNNVIAAAVAALAGWAAFRLFFSGPTETTDLVGRAALEFAVFGGVFGAVVAAWDDARAGLWEAAGQSALAGLVVGAIGGAISGAVAQEIYGKLIKNILENATFEDLGDIYSSPKFYLTRALGWAIFGVGVGASLGVAKRSSRKAINAGIGGAVGGALGGLVFHWASIHIQDESMAQLIGFAVVGIGIGVAIGLVEVARRQAWLKVIGGGMLGKEFIVYHQVTNVGSAPKCEITLIKDPRVGPFHCRIDDRGGRYSIAAYEGNQVSINGTPVTSHWLRTGDAIEVGGTTLQYQERRLPT